MISKPNKNTQFPTPFLKWLREKRNLSQSEMARLMKSTRKKLYTMERKSLEQIALGEIDAFVKALGYRLSDVIQIMGNYFKGNPEVKRIHLDAPEYELKFANGITLQVLLDEEKGNFMGKLLLAPGKSLKRDRLPFRDFVFGIVHEGILLIDAIGLQQQIIKPKQVFYFTQKLPIEFCNTNSYRDLTILLISVPSPRPCEFVPRMAQKPLFCSQTGTEK